MNDPIPELAVTELPQEILSDDERRIRRAEKRKRWRRANPEKHTANCRRHRQNQRRRVFEHYGTSCACCGATDNLTIDHVKGNGAKHRAELGAKGVGQHFYHWLVVNGFPPGFQTLCEPCNQSKARKRACRLDHTEEQDRLGAEDAGRSLIAC